MKNRIVIKIKYTDYKELRKLIIPFPNETAWEWFNRVKEYVKNENRDN